MKNSKVDAQWDPAARKRIAERFQWMVYNSSLHTNTQEFVRGWGINGTTLRTWCLTYLGLTGPQYDAMVWHNGTFDLHRGAAKTRARRNKERQLHKAAGGL